MLQYAGGLDLEYASCLVESLDPRCSALPGGKLLGPASFRKACAVCA